MFNVKLDSRGEMICINRYGNVPIMETSSRPQSQAAGLPEENIAHEDIGAREAGY